MHITLKNRSGLFAVCGTILLFLFPLFLLHQLLISDLSLSGLELMLIIVSGLIISSSIAIGIWCFWKAVVNLTAHSKAVVLGNQEH
jgi:hypothetical protein